MVSPSGPTILALDIGTSSVRALAMNLRGARIPTLFHRESHALDTDRDGTAVFDPQALLDRVELCLDRVAGALAPGTVQAVTISQLVSNVLGVDGENLPLTPVFTYADTRSAPQVEELTNTVNAAQAHQRTGCPLHTSYLPARFLWTQRRHSELMNRSTRWLSFGEWLMERVLGQSACSHSVASWLGLLNIHTLDWDEEWLNLLQIDRSQLGAIAGESQTLSGILPAYRRRWPALVDAVWLPPIADGMASSLGSGCATPSRMALSIGTSGAMRLIHHQAQVPPGLWCYRIDPKQCLIGGALNDAGSVLAWMRSVLKLDAAEIQSALDSGVPDEHGLTLLPFLTGERSPGWCPRARFVALGMNPETTSLQLLRASLESVALRFLAIFRGLQSIAEPNAVAVASGGGFRSLPAWAQMMADALGRPVIMSEEPEPTARGAALVALKALGEIESYEDLPAALGTTLLPRENYHELYLAALERQEELYARLF